MSETLALLLQDRSDAEDAVHNLELFLGNLETLFCLGDKLAPLR